MKILVTNDRVRYAGVTNDIKILWERVLVKEYRGVFTWTYSTRVSAIDLNGPYVTIPQERKG